MKDFYIHKDVLDKHQSFVGGFGGVGKTRIGAIHCMKILKNRFGDSIKALDYALQIDSNKFEYTDIEKYAKDGVAADSDFVLSLKAPKSIKIYSKVENKLSDEILRVIEK